MGGMPMSIGVVYSIVAWSSWSSVGHVIIGIVR